MPTQDLIEFKLLEIYRNNFLKYPGHFKITITKVSGYEWSNE